MRPRGSPAGSSRLSLLRGRPWRAGPSLSPGSASEPDPRRTQAPLRPESGAGSAGDEAGPEWGQGGSPRPGLSKRKKHAVQPGAADPTGRVK